MPSAIDAAVDIVPEVLGQPLGFSLDDGEAIGGEGGGALGESEVIRHSRLA